MDKLKVLRYKIKVIGNKVLDKTIEDVVKPNLHQNDLQHLEDELKPEIDVLNSLAKAISTKKTELEKLTTENRHTTETMHKLHSDLNGELKTFFPLEPR